MDAIEAAENVVALYSVRRTNEALHRQQVCGCRACTATANTWVEWLAGDDDELYEELRIPSKWEHVAN